MNKAGSNAVYVVLAVAFILTASAKATPAQRATAQSGSAVTLYSGANFIVFAGSQCSVHRLTAIPLGTDVLRTSLTIPSWVPSGQDAKYRFAYLKHDPVYVRSKS